MMDRNEKLSGTWVTRNVELAADPAAGWALVQAITTYSGDLEGAGHAGSSTLRTAGGGLRAYANETVAVTGALSGSFLRTPRCASVTSPSPRAWRFRGPAIWRADPC